MNGFCEWKFRSTLLSDIFTKAVMYIMLLCDSVLAGFVEEIGLTVIEQNRKLKKAALIELSLFFEKDSVLIIERDSGKLFDMTDPDFPVEGLSSVIISGLMDSKKEKAYLVTTGYNRNMIRFNRGELVG